MGSEEENASKHLFFFFRKKMNHTCAFDGLLGQIVSENKFGVVLVHRADADLIHCPQGFFFFFFFAIIIIIRALGLGSESVSVGREPLGPEARIVFPLLGVSSAQGAAARRLLRCGGGGGRRFIVGGAAAGGGLSSLVLLELADEELRGHSKEAQHRRILLGDAEHHFERFQGNVGLVPPLHDRGAAGLVQQVGQHRVVVAIDRLLCSARDGNSAQASKSVREVSAGFFHGVKE